ncbi:class I SAM-dependent methyltransferase [Pseudolysobacter antarcticus]|nr:class I SAM-dependent methyltransferase [Pseudolysobacter antarcticus]
MLFWWPLKADPSVYESEGFEAYEDYHSGTRPFPRWAEPLFRALPKNVGAALDIGCGDGAVLSRLAEAGFEPNGIDLDQKSIQVARGKFGLDKAVAMTLEDYTRACQERGQRFDLITFFEVLEHQDSPQNFLAQVTSLGNPCCLIAGSVPNRDRFLARLDRKLSDGDFPPHHFLWFATRPLKHLLERAGFEDVSITRIGALSYFQIVGKLRSLISRRAKFWSRSMQFLAPPLRVAAYVVAVVPWIGMRFSPSHLFFRCRVPG